MDQDPEQNIDQEIPSDAPQSGPSLGERAKGFGDNLKQGADTAKDLLGKAKGGSGDGIGSAIQGAGGGGLGDAANKALGALGGKSGGGGLGKSIDGIKNDAGGGANNKTPSMFKGLENDAKPQDANNLGNESGGNPSAKDSAKKVAGKAAQAASDVVETAKDAKDVARLVASGATDATAWADLAKRALKDPKAFVKRYGRVGLYIGGFFFLQFMVVVAIFGALFFGIYKVYLAGAEFWENPLDVANTLRVSREMGGFLVDSVTALTYERDLAEAKRTGAVFAQDTKIEVEIPTSPETDKMHKAWQSAGIATKFVDEYNAEIKPSGAAPRQVTEYNPADWELYVNGQNMGNLSSSRAMAFIEIFTEDTTKWKDIYARSVLKSTAQKNFETTSFKLDLPDSERSMEKSRENVGKQIITTTLKPIETRSEKYYDCLTRGDVGCAELGLGTESTPKNQDDEKRRGFAGFIQQIRDRASLRLLEKKINQENLGKFSASQGENVDSETVSYENKESLAANIRTGASETILSSIAREDDDPSDTASPDAEVLLEMYDRFQYATENQNFSRVNYDRESRQSVANAFNYFIAGGQLLNNDLGLLDSWAMTENLSVLEESPIFRASVIGNPVGVFAQSDESKDYQSCQKVFDDETPVRKPSEDLERPVKSTSCFRRSLVPSISEFQNEKALSRIYSLMEQKNDELDGRQSIWDRLRSSLTQQLANKEVRTSPVAAEKTVANKDLGPDFDAYTNQVYGVSRTGAEINGEAYDTMATAAEALWAQAALDDEFGTGASYQSDQEVAKLMRYSRSIEREKMAFRPLSDRLFSIKDSSSLTGKLALLTPTNRNDAGKKTLALLKPTNLTSAIAARMIPPTFAQNTQDVNPLGAVRAGYSLGDPSNTMNGSELWEKYNCGSGGPTQEKTQPEGVPFTVPTTTNPCKREVLLSKITTCYFDTEDSCSFKQTTQPTNDTGATPGEISDDSSGTPCFAGNGDPDAITEDLGVRDDAYTNGRRIKIRVCAVNSIPGSSEESNGGVPGANGRAIVSSIASESWGKLGAAAKKAGIPLSAGSSWRTMAHQQRLCDEDDKCPNGDYNDVAQPGKSNHQSGTAIDIAQIYAVNGSPASGRTCSNPQTVNNPTYIWVAANARKYGIKNYANEAWHWGPLEDC